MAGQSATPNFLAWLLETRFADILLSTSANRRSAVHLFAGTKIARPSWQVNKLKQKQNKR